MKKLLSASLQNIYCTNSHKIASFHVIGNNICNTLILLSIIHVIKIFLKQFIPINFLEQKNLYDVWRYHQCFMSIPYIITTKLESKPVKNSHLQQVSIKTVLLFPTCSKRYTIRPCNKSGSLCARLETAVI